MIPIIAILIVGAAIIHRSIRHSRSFMNHRPYSRIDAFYTWIGEYILSDPAVNYDSIDEGQVEMAKKLRQQIREEVRKKYQTK